MVLSIFSILLVEVKNTHQIIWLYECIFISHEFDNNTNILPFFSLSESFYFSIVVERTRPIKLYMMVDRWHIRGINLLIFASESNLPLS